MKGHTDCKFGPCRMRALRRNLESGVYAVRTAMPRARFTPLPKPSIDTGAGLERLASVLQGKINNYDTDLFVPLIKRAGELAGISKPNIPNVEKKPGITSSINFEPSLRIIADHSRAATFLISDGVVPSNDGRGYVLRKIIRRALLHVRFLGAKTPFLSQMSDAVRQEMNSAYPELNDSAGRVSRILDEEERRFLLAIDVGSKKLDEIAASVQQQNATGPWALPSDKAFQLYDTFGFPLDLMRDYLKQRGFTLDEVGLERAMEEQRTRARASWKGGHKEAAAPQYTQLAGVFRTEPDFFYQATSARDCRIEVILKSKVNVPELIAGEEAEVILDRTVIYAESGGQVGDTGAFFDGTGTVQLAEVTGAYYPVAGLIAHRIIAKETLRRGDRVNILSPTVRAASTSSAITLRRI